MRLKITIKQLGEVLKTQPVKYPIEIIMKNVDREELKQIVQLLNKKKS